MNVQAKNFRAKQMTDGEVLMITTATGHTQTFPQTPARSSYKMGSRASGYGKVVSGHELKTAFA